jgi:uncharacterized protein YjbI with pentapeptide repeats
MASDRQALEARWAPMPLQARPLFLDLGSAQFKRVAGRWDLRGLVIKGAVHQVAVEGIDLSFASMGPDGQLGGALHATDVLFEHSRFESTLDGVFVRCSFTKANLAGSTIRERFEQCRFVGASLRGVRTSESAFVDCDFAGASFRSAGFYDSVFKRCGFSANDLHHAFFSGSKFLDCQLPEGFEAIASSQSVAIKREAV